MPFTWVAVYRDGNMLHHIDPDTGIESSSETIDRTRLESFVLFNDQGSPLVVQYMESGQCLIYRRRVEKRLGFLDEVVHLVGWQRNVGGQNVQHISVVFESDGHIENISRWLEGHRWFYDPQPLGADRVVVGP